MNVHEDTLVCPERQTPLLWCEPPNAAAVMVFAHGAGAGMRHAFMETMTEALAAERVATLRFEFPYMARGRKLPDRTATMLATVRSVVEHARGLAGSRPLIAGGKSMGGRMISLAAADVALRGVQGLVFLGFPLFPARATPEAHLEPIPSRAQHLFLLDTPLLFFTGTRDALAPLPSLHRVAEELGPKASVQVIEGADHSFARPKRMGGTTGALLRIIAPDIAAWIRRSATGPASPQER